MRVRLGLLIKAFPGRRNGRRPGLPLASFGSGLKTKNQRQTLAFGFAVVGFVVVVAVFPKRL